MITQIISNMITQIYSGIKDKIKYHESIFVVSGFGQSRSEVRIINPNNVER